MLQSTNYGIHMILCTCDVSYLPHVAEDLAADAVIPPRSGT